MPIQTNYLDELADTIHFGLNDAETVLDRYLLSRYDIVNLCGGITAPTITSIRVIMHAAYTSAISVREFHAWAAAMGRDEPTLSELVQSASGRQLWRQIGFTWIGNFYLTDDHPCMAYLLQHLQRQGIDFDL